MPNKIDLKFAEVYLVYCDQLGSKSVMQFSQKAN